MSGAGPSPELLRVLIVEDSATDAALVVRELAKGGRRVESERVDSAESLAAALERGQWDLVIADYSLPAIEGGGILRLVRQRSADLPFVFVSGTIGEERAVELLKAGADDYVMKHSLSHLPACVDRVLRAAGERRERLRSEQALRESEERFRQMAENVGDVFFLAEADNSRMHYVSPAYERIWGRSCESLYAAPESFMQAIHPEDRAATYESYRKGLESGRFEYRYRIVRPDGAVRWIEARGFPIRDAAGKLYRIVGVAEDITELRESENLRAAILESSLDGLITVDEHGRIVELNAAAAAIFGLSRAEASGQPMAELIIPPRLREAHRRGFARYLSGGEASMLGRRIEMAALRSDGSEFPVELAITPIRNGAKLLFTAWLRDIAPRKAAEARIRRLNRVHAVLSGINSLIVRVRERDELFDKACRIAVESGGFPLAFVALVDAREQQIRAAAWAGDGALFAGLSRPTAGAKASGTPGLSAQAIARRAPAVCNDIAADGSAMRYAKEALEQGYRSAAALPLVVEDAAVGALVLFAAEPGVFDGEEMKLLVELADDISFALEHLERERRIARLSRVNAVLSGINGAIARIRDRDELLRESCRIAVEAGELRLAWIGMVDRQSAGIRPVASSGPDGGLLGMVHLSADPGSGQFGIVGHAVRERQPQVANDVLADERIRYGKESDALGFRSFAAIPLLVHGEARGVIGFHAAEAGFFSEDEMKLLAEVAANIAFALEHIEKQERIERLTRVHALLTGVNALIVRAPSRDELFQEACRIAVEHGRFGLAWVGLVSHEQTSLEPVAWAGSAEGYLERMPLTLNEALPQGRAVTAQAVRQMKAAVANDMANDPRIFTKNEALARGFRSLAVLPLLVERQAIGVLTLYAEQPGFFDDDEMKLLNDLGGDLSFALEHIRKSEKLDYLAYYDALTGLANRSLFLERLAQAASAAERSREPLALGIFNLERFKTINDAFGRQAGDNLLQQVAARLREVTGDATRVARVGADHFGVVIPNVASEERLLQRLEETMRRIDGQPYRVGEAEIRVSTRAGIALFPADAADADGLFRNAEAALKRSRSGDAFTFYAKEMTERVAEKVSLENRLRQALERGEFVLHYQPKVDLETRRVAGVEALIRWQSPQVGLVPPGQFIPLMEETGLILPVGSWALQRAALDHRRWVERGFKELRVAVNVSAIQLRQRDFVAIVEQAIIDGVAPTGIDLEITESLIMEDIERTIEKLDSVRRLGVRIAIDDFGTGYSSLAYLARLPVASLKIDRSFIVKMLDNPDTATVVRTIISLAHSMRLKVVAEGVDSNEQANLLRLLRCDEMQGYLFSKPLPFDQVSALLASAPLAKSSV